MNHKTAPVEHDVSASEDGDVLDCKPRDEPSGQGCQITFNASSGEFILIVHPAAFEKLGSQRFGAFALSLYSEFLALSKATLKPAREVS